MPKVVALILGVSLAGCAANFGGVAAFYHFDYEILGPGQDEIIQVFADSDHTFIQLKNPSLFLAATFYDAQKQKLSCLPLANFAKCPGSLSAISAKVAAKNVQIVRLASACPLRGQTLAKEER